MADLSKLVNKQFGVVVTDKKTATSTQYSLENANGKPGSLIVTSEANQEASTTVTVTDEEKLNNIYLGTYHIASGYGFYSNDVMQYWNKQYTELQARTHILNYKLSWPEYMWNTTRVPRYKIDNTTDYPAKDSDKYLLLTYNGDIPDTGCKIEANLSDTSTTSFITLKDSPTNTPLKLITSTIELEPIKLGLNLSNAGKTLTFKLQISDNAIKTYGVTYPTFSISQTYPEVYSKYYSGLVRIPFTTISYTSFGGITNRTAASNPLVNIADVKTKLTFTDIETFEDTFTTERTITGSLLNNTGFAPYLLIRENDIVRDKVDTALGPNEISLSTIARTTKLGSTEYFEPFYGGEYLITEDGKEIKYIVFIYLPSDGTTGYALKHADNTVLSTIKYTITITSA
jgi:hypothetical protein